MKTLKFASPLPEKILKREKTTTWRVNDDKDLNIGDELSLCYTNGKEFAKAKVTNTNKTQFKDLTASDWEGHEKFSSTEEMYETYSGYYNIKITPSTKLKVIKFKLLQMRE